MRGCERMASRVCAEPGCPVIIRANVRDGRCDEHRRAKDKARGTRQQRGYDAQHDAERARWVPLVATGMVRCWRCRDHIAADQPFDLGHDDEDRSVYRGPEHVSCNRATSTRRG